MRRILLCLALALVGFQATASDDLRLRNRRHIQNDLLQPLIMTDDAPEDDNAKKKRLERLACQPRPQCMADLKAQIEAFARADQLDARNLSPVQALAMNGGEVVVYFPDALAQAKKERQLKRARDLELYHKEKGFPPLDPEGMANFPGNPLYLKFPRDYWVWWQLRYIDKRTAFVLSLCCKSLYTQLHTHTATARYFLKQYIAPSGRGDPRIVSFYNSTNFYDSWNKSDLWEATKRLTSLEWFKEQHPTMDLNWVFGRFRDYELCPRVLFDPGYWCLKRKFHKPDPADSPDFGKKVILATHGGDVLGSILYSGAKLGITAGLLAANIYLLEGKPRVIPDICRHIYEFPHGTFVPSMEARSFLFNWTNPYRTICLTVPTMALLFKDLYMLASSFNSVLGDKDKVLDLRSRWPMWSRDGLPEAGRRRDRSAEAWLRDEFALVTFAFSYCIFLHPQFMMWAIPLTGPVKATAITAGDFAQFVTTNATNSSWVKGCCMMINHYVQPGCYVPWAIDTAKEVTTYSVQEFASQATARLVNAAPMMIMGVTWMFYYFVVRMF